MSVSMKLITCVAAGVKRAMRIWWSTNNVATPVPASRLFMSLLTRERSSTLSCSSAFTVESSSFTDCSSSFDVSSSSLVDCSSSLIDCISSLVDFSSVRCGTRSPRWRRRCSVPSVNVRSWLGRMMYAQFGCTAMPSVASNTRMRV